MSTFIAQSGAVFMIGQHKPWRMSEAAVDAFLDTFELEGVPDLYSQLYDAARQAWGSDYPPRVSSLRLVSSNAPADVLRAKLAASLEVEAALDARKLEPRSL